MSPEFAIGTFAGAAPLPFAALVVGENAIDLTGIGGLETIIGSSAPTVADLLRSWEAVLPLLAEAAGSDLPKLALSDLHTLPPLVPHRIFQAGMNYRKHVVDLAVAHRRSDDSRSDDEIRAEARSLMDSRAAGEPFLFNGLLSAVAGPYDDLVLPATSNWHDWEAELGVVIGRPAFRVGVADALDHVAGYTIVNDITTRDRVFRGDGAGLDWFASKNSPGFLPLGPWIVPSQFVGDPGDLRVTLRLNGQVMQDESTSDMVFGVASIISAAAATTPLLPGDLICTGSPAGNGMAHGRLLRPGDVMEVEITGLGQQRVRSVAEPPGWAESLLREAVTGFRPS